MERQKMHKSHPPPVLAALSAFEFALAFHGTQTFPSVRGPQQANDWQRHKLGVLKQQWAKSANSSSAITCLEIL
jgi:hypothetical protein